MSESYKVLGQAAPALDTLTDLYVVPVGAAAVIGLLSVQHIGDADSATAEYRVSVAVNGAADTPAQVICNDIQLSAATLQLERLGLTLGPGDVVRVRCRQTACAFSLFGTEISPAAPATMAAAIAAHAAANDPHGDRAYADGLSSTPAYKIYTAIVSKTNSTITAHVLQNTFGEALHWDGSNGANIISDSDAFTENKTFITATVSGTFDEMSVIARRIANNFCLVAAVGYDLEQMVSFYELMIEIRVYP